MKIITVPNSILKQPSVPVTTIDKKIIEFITQLELTLINKKNPEGVGLSAPQVGKNICIFSTYLDKDRQREIKTYINPIITKASSKLTLGPDPQKPFMEGCLSIPDIYGPVWRHRSLTLEYQTINPNSFTLTSHETHFESFPARVIQHEFDHLKGILFTERALEQNLPLYQDQNGELVPIKLQS